jgi:ribonuclease VapC
MVVDASALVCILLAEPEAEDFARAIANAPDNVICAPTWVEASMVITARLGSEAHALLLELLERSRVTIVPCDAALVGAAYEAWLRYGRGRHAAGLNFGDCFAYALAKLRAEPLLFKGGDFARTDVVAAVQ